MILDVLGSAGVSEGAEGLVIVVLRGTEVGKHERFRVSAEGVLKQPGQLRVPVGHVRALAVDQRRDDVSQRRQRQVDLRRLLETLAGGSRLALTLGSGQVDQVKLPDPEVLLTIDSLLYN